MMKDLKTSTKTKCLTCGCPLALGTAFCSVLCLETFGLDRANRDEEGGPHAFKLRELADRKVERRRSGEDSCAECGMSRGHYLHTGHRGGIMKTARIQFFECEHMGDLNTYLDDLRSCGARIMAQELHAEVGSATVVIEVDDRPAFMAKFRKTAAFDFCNLGDR